MSHPIVTIELENGQVMTGELYPEKAPNTVNNFISLANSGFYDGLIVDFSFSAIEFLSIFLIC